MWESQQTMTSIARSVLVCYGWESYKVTLESAPRYGAFRLLQAPALLHAKLCERKKSWLRGEPAKTSPSPENISVILHSHALQLAPINTGSLLLFLSAESVAGIGPRLSIREYPQWLSWTLTLIPLPHPVKRCWLQWLGKWNLEISNNSKGTRSISLLLTKEKVI